LVYDMLEEILQLEEVDCIIDQFMAHYKQAYSTIQVVLDY